MPQHYLSIYLQARVLTNLIKSLKCSSSSSSCKERGKNLKQKKQIKAKYTERAETTEDPIQPRLHYLSCSPYTE